MYKKTLPNSLSETKHIWQEEKPLSTVFQRLEFRISTNCRNIQLLSMRSLQPSEKMSTFIINIYPLLSL